MTDNAKQTDLKTILYVDDDASSRYLVTEIIEGHTPYQIITSDCLSEGLQACPQARPALILLDINLKTVSGYDVLTEIRQDPDMTNLPIIALSGHIYREDIEKGLSAGFDAYLTKPINMQEFIDTVSRFLGPA